ncbi:unnamed protein product [Peniophora sp. CBMAI 1063]|nr:unnamed protein product [Peniophora sp. CBMAI 1063]
MFVLPASLVLSSTLALAAPQVDLLIDHGFQHTGPINLKQSGVLSRVSARKGQPFHFGSTLNTTRSHVAWTSEVFSTFWGHMVAEDGCKWYATEPDPGRPSLADCRPVQEYAEQHGNSFRGHNTFWHQELPDWLPGNFSAHTLVSSIIPTHVRAEISGMGPAVTSWDVVNEPNGDNVTFGMTPLECVQNKDVWPTVVSDGSTVPLVKDLSFLYAAFSAAHEAAGPGTRLALNDYNTGGNDAKTACAISVLKDIQAHTKIPFDRLAMGFQSHVQETNFVSKAELTSTFAELTRLGVNALVTEIDIALTSDSEEDLRMQAAIWGDYVDVCLFASNCHEFISWDTRDNVSWLGEGVFGTLHDKNGVPKPAAYEVAARLTRFARGGKELCATALGAESCRVG